MICRFYFFDIKTPRNEAKVGKISSLQLQSGQQNPTLKTFIESIKTSFIQENHYFYQAVEMPNLKYFQLKQKNVGGSLIFLLVSNLEI